MSPTSTLTPTRLVLVLGVLLLSLLGAATPARAGDYAVNLCPSSPPKGLTDWVATTDGAAMPGIRLTERCDQGVGLTIDGSESRQSNSGQSVWRYTAPPGTTIADWEAVATASAIQDRSYLIGLVLRDGQGSYGAECGLTAGPCSSTLATPRDKPNGTHTTALFSLTCVPTGEYNICQGPVSATMVRNIITLRDNVAPTGEVTGGTLAASGPGNPIAGTVGADFVATDNAAGVRRVEARVDGAVVGATAPQCDPPFTSSRPCPARLPGTVTADLSGVSQGTHSLRIVAIDASGTEGILRDGPIVVDNGGPVGPGTDGNVRGAPNGNHAGDDAKVEAWWPATGRAPSSRAAVKRKCARSAAYRRTHKLSCVGRAPQQKLAVRFSTKRSNLVRGRVLTSAGQPIAGAKVNVVATAAGRTRVVAQPVTSAAGTFDARLPVRTGSASLAVQWLAKARDSVPAAATTLTRTVRAATTFTTARSARAGKRLVLSGRLAGRSGAQKGVPILIQINAGSGWRAATTVLAGADGRWRARYGVPRQLRGTYRFRAVVRGTARYPYATAASKARRVRIR